jgi:hypothetical protein
VVVNGLQGLWRSMACRACGGQWLAGLVAVNGLQGLWWSMACRNCGARQRSASDFYALQASPRNQLNPVAVQRGKVGELLVVHDLREARSKP